MRWLVLFLIVLNALVFAWFHLQEQNTGNNIPVTEALVDLRGASSLQMLAELDKEVLNKRDLHNKDLSWPASDGLQSAEEVVAQNKGEQCIIFGAYPEVISARQARLDMHDDGVTARIVMIPKLLPAVSWVYIPSTGDKEKALAVLMALQGEKIDSFLVKEEGEYQYAISLGFFGNPASAEKVKQERVRQGYDAQIIPRVRERDAFYLAFDGEDAVKQKALEMMKKATESDGVLKKQEISCEALAQKKTIH